MEPIFLFGFDINVILKKNNFQDFNLYLHSIIVSGRLRHNNLDAIVSNVYLITQTKN